MNEDKDIDLQDRAKDLLETGLEYMEDRLSLIMLEVSEKSSKVLSQMAIGFALGALALFILLFGSLALASYIGGLLENSVYGYLLVSLGYGLLALLLFFNKSRLIGRPLTNLIIKKIYQ